ncbi:hypothetical protein CLOSTMETH_02910 [[Clostridium] methylpentosum DSM 5476]|uniref:Uncharacterized protein n=1 Tax=[Clostridium] methylpentosum DSM 5476 TaxID=537013 RepID=C0EGB7_9FIRM|nr:hypothetical protein CLOSTMETH_02910 [[Clostridium] methylpentosum DSM 5476]
MRLPNLLDCSAEVYLPWLFLFIPGRTGNFHTESDKNVKSLDQTEAFY